MTWDPAKELRTTAVTKWEVYVHGYRSTNGVTNPPIGDELATVEVHGCSVDGRSITVCYILRAESAESVQPQLMIEPVGVMAFVPMPISVLSGLLSTVQQPGSTISVGIDAHRTSLFAGGHPGSGSAEAP